MFREIEDIVETLRDAKTRGIKCSVLIGAGCSVTAGIPTAQGFVDIIGKRYKGAYKRAGQKTYPQVMAQLSIGEQRNLIEKHIDKAKINWAHIAIAQLMKAGYIDRVLTTNFDPLLIRACALVGLFPATYDLAASQHFEAEKVPEQAIFYLHGQRTGFILINDPKAFKSHSAKLAPVFNAYTREHVWLVVGYSGENDPVFEHLARVPHFDNRLYWVGYNDADPATEIQKRLLVDGKYAFYTKGFDADSFFVSLAQDLGCFPPDFVGKPFSYLDKLFEVLTPYTPPKNSSPIDDVYFARKYVQGAIKSIEDVQVDVLQAEKLLYAGEYDNVIKLSSKYDGAMHTELVGKIAWAYVMQGNILAVQARAATGARADKLFKQAKEKYGEALRVMPGRHEALYNWGNVLIEEAERKRGEEARDLLRQAGQKYEDALKIDPESHEALYNWGNALMALAKTEIDEDAYDLLDLAGTKFEAALRIDPEKHEALNNWGNVLVRQAKTRKGDEADQLFKQAMQKFADAIRIKPDKHEALNNWGNALQAQAKMKEGKEADRIFKQAGEKYADAFKIKPDKHEALNNWGNALQAQAKMKEGKKATLLFERAGQKYADALSIKPDFSPALNNWGNALVAIASIKKGKEANQLYRLAEEKYEAAIKIMPSFHEAVSNFGNALSDWASTKAGLEADQLFHRAYGRYEAALKIKPDKHEVLNNWGHALVAQAKTKSGEAADELFKLAGEKYKAALRIRPNSSWVLNNWGNALDDWARTKTGKQADDLFKLAGEKYAASLRIVPNSYGVLFNWGNTLVARAVTKSGKQADKLIRLAGEKYEAVLQIKPDDQAALEIWGNILFYQAKLVPKERRQDSFMQAKDLLCKADSLMPGSASYDLACLCALTGEGDECQRWLDICKKTGNLPKLRDLEQDSDLDLVRDQPWFKELLGTIA